MKTGGKNNEEKEARKTKTEGELSIRKLSLGKCCAQNVSARREKTIKEPLAQSLYFSFSLLPLRCLRPERDEKRKSASQNETKKKKTKMRKNVLSY